MSPTLFDLLLPSAPFCIYSIGIPVVVVEHGYTVGMVTPTTTSPLHAFYFTPRLLPFALRPSFTIFVLFSHTRCTFTAYTHTPHLFPHVSFVTTLRPPLHSPPYLTYLWNILHLQFCCYHYFVRSLSLRFCWPSTVYIYSFHFYLRIYVVLHFIYIVYLFTVVVLYILPSLHSHRPDCASPHGHLLLFLIYICWFVGHTRSTFCCSLFPGDCCSRIVLLNLHLRCCCVPSVLNGDLGDSFVRSTFDCSMCDLWYSRPGDDDCGDGRYLVPIVTFSGGHCCVWSGKYFPIVVG